MRVHDISKEPCILSKEPCILSKEPFSIYTVCVKDSRRDATIWCAPPRQNAGAINRAQHPVKRALHFVKGALYSVKGALHSVKGALYSVKRALHSVKRALCWILTHRLCVSHRDKSQVQSPTFCQKSPTFCQKSPTFCQKSPTFCQKSPTFCQKSPTFCQPSPTFCRKSPIFYIKHRFCVLHRDESQVESPTKIIYILTAQGECVCVCV